ncbi:hypothetical protein FACS1894188_01800 [Clostridia bacterium]|nr:hypothetical protein FACS1894188_01800 [Clostridia bacterium]
MAGEQEVAALGSIAEKSLQILLEILRFLHERNGSGQKQSGGRKVNTASGKISQKDLIQNARANNESVMSQDGITKKDMKNIAKKAKEMGIPVAFIGKKDKDNIKVSFRGNDRALFEQVLQDIVKEKIELRPNELSTFKIEKEHIQNFWDTVMENDVPIMLTQDAHGDYNCVHEAKDAKVLEAVRAEFEDTVSEVSADISVEKTDEYFVIKDEISGEEISFSQEDIPDKTSLSKIVQDTFGYDVIKANMTADKFANSLDGEQQAVFYQNSPFSFVNHFEQNIKLKDESVLVHEFNFYRLNLKENGVDTFGIVDKDGKAVTLVPENTTREDMIDIIKTRLGVSDETAEALTDKTERAAEIYKKDIFNRTEDVLDKNGAKIGEYDIKRTEVVMYNVSYNGETKKYAVHTEKKSVEKMQKDFGMDKKTAQRIHKKANKQREDSKENEVEKVVNVKKKPKTDEESSSNKQSTRRKK